MQKWQFLRIPECNYMALIKGVVDTFTLHEGQPGHHMQVTFRNNLKTIPKFMRYNVGSKGGVPSSLPKYSAYIEGWGLYSEYLGYELGIYKNNPLSEIGYLMGDLLRYTFIKRYSFLKSRS